MRRKILLADDSITIQKVVNLTFSDEGIDVVTVGNGELAINKLADVRPDIVLADVWMPGRDGYELCEYVKTHPEYKHLPVLLLVGAFEPFDKVRAAAVKADGHLTKPFESRALVATVKKLLEQSAPVINEAFTPPPPLTGDAGRTQIFGSVVNPKPVDSQPRPVSSDIEPPPPTIKISASQLEDGRNPDLDPLIPVAPAEPAAPPPTAESVLELTIPEQNEPILIYPEPPPTLATPVEPPTFTSPEPPALGVATSRLAPGELETILQQPAPPTPPTDTSPLEIDDDVIESTHHPVMPEPAAVRDPLLDTFADVAESTSDVQSSFDPAVETTAYSGTVAAFVSNVSGEEAAAPTAAPIPAPDFAEPVPAPEFLETPPETWPTETESAPVPFVEPELKETTPPAETPEEASTATNRTTLEVASPMAESMLNETSEPVLETGPIEALAPPAEPSSEPPAAPVFEVALDEDERVGGTDLLPSELVASLRAREAATETAAPVVAPVEEPPPPPEFTFELPPDNEPVVEAVVVPPPVEAAPVSDIPAEPVIQLEPVFEPPPEPVADPVLEIAPEPLQSEPVAETPVETPAEPPSADVIVPAVVAGVTAIAAPMVAEAAVARTEYEEDSVEPEGPTTGEIVPAPVTGELVAPESAVEAGQVSQAVIDDIVKRVVAQMSERVIREIAWEVVPDLAELLIKKHLASTNGAK